ncbi:MAG: hypothetical protein NTX09_18585 [Verrucomicrobia bacterium]|nr:hypothetical protein [Verrucomicrobiota bacterium]
MVTPPQNGEIVLPTTSRPREPPLLAAAGFVGVDIQATTTLRAVSNPVSKIKA